VRIEKNVFNHLIEKRYKSIVIARLFLKYLSFVFGAILVITIFYSMLYFNSYYRYPFFCNTCAGCRGCSRLLGIEYEQAKLIFFTMQLPWIVSLNIIAIVITLFLEIFFKKISNRSIIQNPNVSKNQILVDNLNRLKYKGIINKEFGI